MKKPKRDAGPYLRLWTRDLFGDPTWIRLSFESRCAWLAAKVLAFHLGDSNVKPANILKSLGAGPEEVRRVLEELQDGLGDSDPIADARVWIEEWEAYRGTRSACGKHGGRGKKATAKLERHSSDTTVSPAPAPALIETQSLSDSSSLSPPTPPRGAGRRKKVWEGDIPAELQTPDFQEAWKAYLTHRSEIRKPLTPRAGDMLLRRLAGWGARRAVAAIHHSISQSWTGIFEEETQGLRQGSRINGHAGEDRGVSELAEIRRRMAERNGRED